MASMAHLRALEESYKSKETLIYRGGQARSHLALRPASGLAKAGRNGAPMAHLREWVKLLLGGHDVGSLPRKNYKSRVETLVEMIHNDIQGQAGSLPSCTPTAPGPAKGGRNGVDG